MSKRGSRKPPVSQRKISTPFKRGGDVTPMTMDGWHSALTGIGGMMTDRRQKTEFFAEPTNWIENSEMWRGDDLAARIVETIPNEMTRQGYELAIEGEAGNVKNKMKDITAFGEDLGINEVFWRALCFERAYGGAAVLLGCNDLRDMAEPLDEESITSLNWIEVYEPHEMQALTWQQDPNQRHFGQPETYRFSPIAVGGATVTGVEIHRSRLIIFPGIRVSRRIMGTQPGWGDAVLTRCRTVLRDFQGSWDATGILLTEFAQAVLKIKGLAELIALGKDEELKNRIRAIHLSRSVANMVVIDAEAEEFERKQTPITGLAELLDKFGTRLAAAADMPLTLLMGTSPGGLNATGESDIRGFYDRVKAMQVRKLKPAIERIYRLIMRALDIAEPDSWSIKFHPLWQPTEKEIVDTRWIQTQMDEKNVLNSILSAEEVRKSRYGGSEYSIETQIDPNAVIEPPTPDPSTPPFGDKSQATPSIKEPEAGNGQSPDEDSPTRSDEVLEGKDGWHVFSSDGEKHLGGPYPSKAKAITRLRQIEHFKEDGTMDWFAYYQQMADGPLTRSDALAQLTNEEVGFLQWCTRFDADEQPRAENGQFASAGAAGAAARSSAKEALGHAQALRTIAAKSGSAVHQAASDHAEKSAKGARASARKAEAATTVSEAAGHAAKAAAHAASARAKLTEVQGGPVTGQQHAEARTPAKSQDGKNPGGALKGGRTGDAGKEANELSAAAHTASGKANKSGTAEDHLAAAKANLAAARAQHDRGLPGTANDHQLAAANHQQQAAKAMAAKPTETVEEHFGKAMAEKNKAAEDKVQGAEAHALGSHANVINTAEAHRAAADAHFTAGQASSDKAVSQGHYDLMREHAQKAETLREAQRAAIPVTPGKTNIVEHNGGLAATHGVSDKRGQAGGYATIHEVTPEDLTRGFGYQHTGFTTRVSSTRDGRSFGSSGGQDFSAVHATRDAALQHAREQLEKQGKSLRKKLAKQ